MLKKWIALVLCAVTLFCFTACGKNNCRRHTTPHTVTDAVFNTKNIKGVTFYIYSGNSKGFEVTDKNLDEIKWWLDSFAFGEKAPDKLPTGTNTILVEIRYTDGCVIKQGMDAVDVDGVMYYVKGETAPKCYYDLFAETY